MVFDEIKTNRVSHLIVEQIRRKIIIGEFKPGDYLPTELELSKKFAVSRSSVREALQLLEGFGVIERRKKVGTIIRNVTIEDLAGVYTPKPEKETLVEILETRETIEESIVKLAIERASIDEIEEMEKTLDWMAENPESAAQNDIVFHIMLARLSHNEVMVSIVHSLKKEMDKFINPNRVSSNVNEINNQHRDIVKAIKERNLKLTLKHTKKHWDTSRENLLK